MHRAGLVAIVMVSLAMTLQNCSMTSCLSCFGTKYDLEKLVDLNDEYGFEDIKSAMPEVDRQISPGSVSSVSAALKSYLKSLKSHRSVPPTIKDVERGALLLAAEMVLALEDQVSAKRPKCDEIMYKLVYTVFVSSVRLGATRPLRRFVDYYINVYVDTCLPHHLETIEDATIDGKTLTDVNKQMENLIEATGGRKVAELSELEFFGALWEFRPLPDSGPIGRVLYKTLVDLGGDEAQQVLQRDNSLAIKQLLETRLKEPCLKLSNTILHTTLMIRDELRMSPRPLVNVDGSVLRRLGLSMACLQFWKTTHDKLAGLVKYAQGLNNNPDP